MPTIDGLGFPVNVAVVPGGLAASDLGPVGGIDATDSLIVVRHITPDLVTNADVTGEASITDADTVQLSTTDTTGDFVVAVWQENE